MTVTLNPSYIHLNLKATSFKHTYSVLRNVVIKLGVGRFKVKIGFKRQGCALCALHK